MAKDLKQVLETGYDFDFNKIVNTAWKIMNAKMGPFLLMTILLIIIQLVFVFIPLVNIFNGLIGAILFSGYFIYSRGITQNREDLADFFKGFNYVGPIFLYRLVFFLLFVPFVVLFIGAMFPISEFLELVSENATPEDIGYIIGEQMATSGVFAFVGFIIFFCAAIYLSLSYIFVIPLIVDGNMKFWDAMELSRKTVSMKFMSFLGYGILLYFGLIISMLLTCFVGLIFIIPLLYCIVFAAYDSIFQPYESEAASDLESFGEIEKDINSESQENL